MSLPIQIDDRCSCCEEDYLVLCNGCGKFLDITKFATYRIGEQTGYSEQGGAYCKSCSEKCKACGDHFAIGSFDNRGICFCCMIWGKWSTV